MQDFTYSELPILESTIPTNTFVRKNVSQNINNKSREKNFTGNAKNKEHFDTLNIEYMIINREREI